jgi:hypothetical protein
MASIITNEGFKRLKQNTLDAITKTESFEELFMSIEILRKTNIEAIMSSIKSGSNDRTF